MISQSRGLQIWQSKWNIVLFRNWWCKPSCFLNSRQWPGSRFWKPLLTRSSLHPGILENSTHSRLFFWKHQCVTSSWSFQKLCRFQGLPAVCSLLHFSIPDLPTCLQLVIEPLRSVGISRVTLLFRGPQISAVSLPAGFSSFPKCQYWDRKESCEWILYHFRLCISLFHFIEVGYWEQPG